MTDVVTTLTGFAGALRAVGINADRARLTTSLEALHELDPGNADHVYWATKLALCSEPDDLAKFDAVFDLWFRGVAPAAARSAADRAGSVRQRAAARRRRAGQRGAAAAARRRGAAHRGERDRGAAPPRRRHPHPRAARRGQPADRAAGAEGRPPPHPAPAARRHRSRRRARAPCGDCCATAASRASCATRGHGTSHAGSYC